LQRSCGVLAAGTIGFTAATWTQAESPRAQPAPKARLDHSGLKRVGEASYYGPTFSGRKMADGTPMRPESDNAASRTLPLGTTARVTNLRDGRSALVTIRDRGPYAKGRIIDLSPRTAKQLGMLHSGVARVEVEPIKVPQPNGEVMLMVALAEPQKASVQR
jgi:rare lipoprotein A